MISILTYISLQDLICVYNRWYGIDIVKRLNHDSSDCAMLVITRWNLQTVSEVFHGLDGLVITYFLLIYQGCFSNMGAFTASVVKSHFNPTVSVRLYALCREKKPPYYNDECVASKLSLIKTM